MVAMVRTILNISILLPKSASESVMGKPANLAAAGVCVGMSLSCTFLCSNSELVLNARIHTPPLDALFVEWHGMMKSECEIFRKYQNWDSNSANKREYAPTVHSYYASSVNRRRRMESQHGLRVKI